MHESLTGTPNKLILQVKNKTTRYPYHLILTQ